MTYSIGTTVIARMGESTIKGVVHQHSGLDLTLRVTAPGYQDLVRLNVPSWQIEVVTTLPTLVGAIIQAPSGRFVRTASTGRPWLGIDGHTAGIQYPDCEFGVRTTILYNGEPRN